MSLNNKDQQTGKIGFWLSTSLVVGNMIGSGIFLLPAALAFYGGISIFGWMYTLGGTIFLALVFSRLSKLITKAGGPYTYSREGFGDFAGFLVAWGYWISIWCGNAAIAVAGVGYLSVFVPALKENQILSAGMAIGAIWLFTFINTKSIKKVGFVQLITTIIKILPLLLLGTFGFLYFNSTHFTPFNLSDRTSFYAITATAALALWAFLGLESATIPSDKVKNPTKTIARATIAGIVIAALLYISSTVGVMGIIIASVLASILVSMNYTKGLLEMFSFIIMLSTLACLLPYLFSSLTEVTLYLRRKKNYNKNNLIAASLISIPALLYSVWAITGLEYEIIIWGAILLTAGLPIYAYLTFQKRKNII